METASNMKSDPEIIEAEATVSDEPAAKETKVVKYSVTMAQIAKLQEEYKEVPKDLTVKANYELVRKAASHLRTLRTDVEKRRKELKADALAWGKLVDGTAKEITEKLLAIEEPFATAKKDFDTAAEIAKREAALAEEKRVDGIAERIASIKALVEANFSSSSSHIKTVLTELEEGPRPEEWAAEFTEKANEVVAETMKKLGELWAMKLQQETAAAEQAASEEKRKREEEEARKKREQEVEEERKKLAAEREAMEAEKARLAAEQKEREEKAAAEKAEADRIQKEKDDAAEAERQRMADEIADLKRQQEEKEKPVVVESLPATHVADVSAVEEQTVPVTVQNHPPAKPTSSTGYGEDYKATGNAMLKFIGNKAQTKALLDSIINGDIPNIIFKGQAQ